MLSSTNLEVKERGAAHGHKQHSDGGGRRISHPVFDAPPLTSEPRRLASYVPGKTPNALAIVWCLVVLANGACAARQDRLSKRFVKPGSPKVALEEEVAGAGRQDLRDYTRKLRALQSKTRSKSTLLPTIETQDPALAAALLRLALIETAEHHRLVAAAYRRNGITDFAYRHYQRALHLEACDSLAFEGLAQVWRDWGMPDLALGDAYRAVHCRPESASAHNTLGTVFQALGQRKNARREFERAVELDGHAAFALNNLCYVSLREGNGRRAQQMCERALAQDPALAMARQNLALAHVAQGDTAGAESELLKHPDRAVGLYAVGMLRMAVGQYAAAAEAFDAVVAERPTSLEARRRAAQARAQLVAYREQ